MEKQEFGTMKEIRKLKQLDACNEAIEWLHTQSSFGDAWQNCQRGDWMLWLLRKTLNLSDEAQLRQLTLAKARCAKLVIHLMKDERSKKAVEIAEEYGNGKTTKKELDAAADTYAYAAYAAADTYAADAYAAAADAYAAAHAAYAAYAATAYAATADATADAYAAVAAADAAAYAAYAATANAAAAAAANAATYAYAAAYAADAAADAYAAVAAADAAAARQDILSQCASLVRDIFPNAPEL